jgi:hypothetical protein
VPTHGTVKTPKGEITHQAIKTQRKKNMKNGNEGEWEETKNFTFTIKRGYPVHNLNHIIHRKLF